MKRSLTATVAERGQVTIPKAIRDKLAIGPGTRLEFSTSGGELVAVKEIPHDAVEKVYGCLRKKVPTNRLISQLRGSR